MQQKFLFQSCCRLCLDDTKEQKEIASVERLAETLEKLYDLKVAKDDRCSKKICIDCQREAIEAVKFLALYEEHKQKIRENQERFAAELIVQLGPEPVPEPPQKSPRSARLSARRSTRRNATDTPTEELGQIPPDQIKEEEPAVVTRSRRSRSGPKQEWEPPASDNSDTPTSSSGSSSSGTNDEDSASTADSGTTTSSDPELKCPECCATFTELAALEKHKCKFVCSICCAELKHKKSLKKHLMTTHNVREEQWESYWNPPQEQDGAGKEQSLLVEGRKPRKRYRYESDSPSDIEDNNEPSGEATAAAAAAALLKVSGAASRRDRSPDDDLRDELVKIYCSLCNESFSGTHDCPYVCDICGNTFAQPKNVRRHKINVHKIDADDPSLTRRKSISRPPSRASSRPPSRAVSEAGSDDDLPLSTVAGRSRCNSVASNRNEGGTKVYRFFCMDCDYTNTRRYRVTKHMKDTHGIPADQIDPEAIQKELLGTRSKTPEPPRMRHSTGSRMQAMTPFDEILAAAGGTAPPLDPAPLDAGLPESASFPVLETSSGFRSRSKSTYQDDWDRKRKRSMSACSMREPRTNRAVSERNVLVAKRRLTNAELLSRINTKFRPTVSSIQANRLHVRSQLSCVPVGTPLEQPLRPRVSSYHPEEPCPNKRLYRRRTPDNLERAQLTQLRSIFQSLSDRIPAASSVNAIDVDSLVLIPSDVLPPSTLSPPPTEEPLPAQQPEPDSTTPVAEEPMDTDETPIPVVIEIAEEVAATAAAEAAAAASESTSDHVEVVTTETIETTEERSEEIVSEEVRTTGEGQEVEETVHVVVEEEEESAGGGEEILPD